tara:strand:- start:79 stop:294 length:216 start_codon:yes stop_codon:yes gene_type:complete
VTTIREDNDGSNNGALAELLYRLLDIAELLYQLLHYKLRRQQQWEEEMRMEIEQNLFMPYEFDLDFKEEKQ